MTDANQSDAAILLEAERLAWAEIYHGATAFVLDHEDRCTDGECCNLLHWSRALNAEWAARTNDRAAIAKAKGGAT